MICDQVSNSPSKRQQTIEGRLKKIVDKWVELSKALPQVGSMTSWERVEKSFRLEQPDIVPCAIEYELFMNPYAGYDYRDLWNRPDYQTDASLKCWHDMRLDALWAYIDLTDGSEPLWPPERRPTNPWDPSSPTDMLKWRGPKDYTLANPLSHDVDHLIKLFEDKVWEKYGLGTISTDWIPHMNALLEFQNRMDNSVPLIGGLSEPFNTAEVLAEVQNIIKWSVTKKDKLHHLLNLILENYLNSFLPVVEEFCHKGLKVVCVFGGMRTLGPKQIKEFGDYALDWFERLCRVIHAHGGYVFWHVCGPNIKAILELIRDSPVDGVQYDLPYKQEWLSYTDTYERQAAFWEWTAKTYKDRKCMLNGPSTQQVLFENPKTLKRLVRKFIEVTARHTTCIIMPGCEISSYTPVEHVTAVRDATREYGVYR